MRELPDLTSEDLHITYNLANEPGLGATAYRTRQMIAEILRRRGSVLDDGDLASLRWLQEFVDARTFNYDGESGRALGLIDRLLAAHGAKP